MFVNTTQAINCSEEVGQRSNKPQRIQCLSLKLLVLLVFVSWICKIAFSIRESCLVLDVWVFHHSDILHAYGDNFRTSVSLHRSGFCVHGYKQ